MKKNCCGIAGPGFGQDQEIRHFRRHVVQIVAHNAGAVDAETNPDRLEGVRAEIEGIHFIVAPRLAMSVVARASSKSFMRSFWLSGGSCPSLPLETYHWHQGTA